MKTVDIRRHVYLSVPPATVWRALVDPKLVKQYYYEMELKAELRKGGDFSYWWPEKPSIRGKVVSIAKGRKLVTTFAFWRLNDAPSRVSFEVKKVGRVTDLAFAHTGLDPRSKTYKWVSGGWDGILSALKTLLETGKPLRW